MTRRAVRLVLAGVVCGAMLLAPEVAAAAEAKPSILATAPYDLDFTLPTESKSGCMVCHGDPALVRTRDGVLKSYYIPPEQLAASAHANQQCVGCHMDFTYKAPHGVYDWKTTAKAACRNCHDEAARAYGSGVHRPSASPTATPAASVATPTPAGEATSAPKPLCGDCHGAHDISVLTTDTPQAKAGRAAMHRNGWQVCGRCHEEYWDNYNDYYHGAAYKRGALDAPACWDCHGWHDILPSKDRASRVNEAHLVETCGQTGCHEVGVDENYVEYAVFIHGRDRITAENWLVGVWRTFREAVGRLFGRK
jgi:hypothetical protein